MTDGSLALTLLRAVISLALVLGLLVFCMRLLARHTGLTPSTRMTAVPVDLVGRRQLSRGSSVQVVKVGGRVLVLGVTETEVSLLTHLSPDDLPADEDEEVPASGSSAAPPALIEALRKQGRTGNLIADVTGRSRGGRHRGGSRV